MKNVDKIDYRLICRVQFHQLIGAKHNCANDRRLAQSVSPTKEGLTSPEQHN